jgi:hypothetical protein
MQNSYFDLLVCLGQNLPNIGLFCSVMYKDTGTPEENFADKKSCTLLSP